MYRKKWMKMTAVLLGVSMVVPMAGCSEQEQENPENGKTEMSAETEDENFDPMAKYEEPITVTTVVGLSDIMQQLLGIQEDVDTNNSWYNGYKEDLGIKVENVWSVPGTQYEQKLNAAISADDLPDVFQVSQEQLKTLIDNGMAMDLTEVFEKYATDFTMQMMEDDGYVALDQCKVDGRLYALPNVSGNYDNVPIMWVRSDWMKQLGKEVPTTLEELENLALAFSNEDPDGNGQDDTYGIALTNQLYNDGLSSMTGIMEIFGAHNGWVDVDGKAEFGLIQPEVKNALESMHEWYENGILDQEFVAKDSNKVAEDIVAGKVGITFGGHANAFWPFPDAKKLNPDAEWRPFPIPGLDDNLPEVMVGSSAVTYYAVNANCEHPEAIVKMYNYFYQKDCALSPDYDEKYHITGDQTAHPDWAMDWAVLKSFYPKQNLFIYNGVKSYLEGDESQMGNAWVSSNVEQITAYMEDPKENAAWWSTYIWSGPEGAFSVVDSYDKNNQRLQNLYIYGNTDGMAMYNVTLEQLIMETYTKIITGEKESSSFEDFVEEWKSLGGNQITQEVNDFIGR